MGDPIQSLAIFRDLQRYRAGQAAIPDTTEQMGPPPTPPMGSVGRTFGEGEPTPVPHPAPPPQPPGEDYAAQNRANLRDDIMRELEVIRQGGMAGLRAPFEAGAGLAERLAPALPESSGVPAGLRAAASFGRQVQEAYTPEHPITDLTPIEQINQAVAQGVTSAPEYLTAGAAGPAGFAALSAAHRAAAGGTLPEILQSGVAGGVGGEMFGAANALAPVPRFLAQTSAMALQRKAEGGTGTMADTLPEQIGAGITGLLMGGTGGMRASEALREAIAPAIQRGGVRGVEGLAPPEQYPPVEPPPGKGPVGGGRLVENFPTSEIHADPELFQYKQNVDEKGVTNAYKNVEVYNPELGGILSVWRRPADGKVYVINGHHRLEIAQRTNTPGVDVRFIDAANEGEARTTGALINIAEDNGTSLDAAKVFRDSSLTPQELQAFGISMGKRIAAEGMGLAQLGDAPFNRVVQGDLTPELGAILGREIPKDEAGQMAVLKLIEQEGGKLTPRELERTIRYSKAAPQMVEQETDLFGNRIVQKNLAVEKAKLAESIAGQFDKDRRAFGYVAGRGEQLKRGGNVIDPAQSTAISNAARDFGAYFETEATSQGPVADLLNEGARRIGNGEPKDQVLADIFPRIREALSTIVPGGQGKGALLSQSGSPIEAPQAGFTFGTPGERGAISLRLLGASLFGRRSGERPPAADPILQSVRDKISVGEKEPTDVSPLYGGGVRGYLNRQYTRWLNDLHPLWLAERQAQHYGYDIHPSLSPSTRAQLSRGVTGVADTFLHRGIVDYDTRMAQQGTSYEDVLRPVASRIEDFRDYAAALHALSIEADGKESGFGPGEALHTVQTYASPEFSLAAHRLQQYRDGLVKYITDAGLISGQEARDMLAKWQNYVPSYRQMEPSQRVQTQGAQGQQLGSVPKPVQHLEGSKRVWIDPLESFVKQSYLFTALAEKNAVAQRIGYLAGMLGPDNGLVDEYHPPVRPVTLNAKELVELAKKLGLDPKDIQNLPNSMIAAFRPDYGIPKGEPIISALFNGERRYFRLDPDLYKAVMALDRQALGPIMEWVAKPARLLRAGAILDPNFQLRNPLRDFSVAAVQMGLHPGQALRGFLSTVARDDLYWRFKASGGDMASMAGLDRESLQQHLADVMRPRVGNPLNIVRDPTHAVPAALQQLMHAGRHPIETLRGLAEVSEQATRVGMYGKALKETGGQVGTIRDMLRGRAQVSGGDPFAAALAAREGTIDFARAGTAGRYINAIAAFTNANAQGIDTAIRTFARNPKAFTTRALLGLTAPTVGLWLLNKNDKEIQDLPQWQRDLFWIIRPNAFIGQSGGPIYRLPKPFELGMIFASLPERILDQWYQHDPQAVTKWAAQAMSTFAPNRLIPTAAVPVIEQLYGKSFFTQRPLVPKGLENVAPAYQATSYTGLTARKLGEAFNISPAVVENYVRDWGGGLGIRGLRLSDQLPGAAATVAGKLGAPGVENAIQKWTGGFGAPPGVGSGIPGIEGIEVRSPTTQAEPIQDAWNMWTAAQQARATLNHLRKTGRDAEADQWEERNAAVLDRYDELRDWYKSQKQAQQDQQEINDMKGLTSAEKEDRKNKITRSMIDEARALLGR